MKFLGDMVELRPGDCRDVIKAMPDNSIDAVVTDPPYALVSIQKRFGKEGSAPTKDGDVYSRSSAGFMGKQWDTGETAFATEFWAEVFRVLKPGGHVVAFSGTRTYHRMAVAIEDAGFEIRDQLAWCYGSGFPKGHDVSKGIDKRLGAEPKVVGKKQAGMGSGKTFGMLQSEGDNLSAAREVDVTEPATPQPAAWQGWNTALKPAWEPICMARKPLIGTVVENVLTHGTGAINVGGCRVGDSGGTKKADPVPTSKTVSAFGNGLNGGGVASIDAGRWPANIVTDGSEEVFAAFPETGPSLRGINDSGGSAARLYYTAKADKLDRIGSKHPTVKPVDLMQWLIRLITPKGGVVLDPFGGSGSTGEAAWREGMRCILIEREPEYQADIAERLRLADKGPATRKARAIKQAANDNALPLFGGVDAKPELKGEGRKVYGEYADQAPRKKRNGGGSDGGVMAGKGGFGFRIREQAAKG